MKIFLKIIAFIIWISLVSGITYAIYHEQELFQLKSQSIAKMTSKSGDILYRQEGLVRWRETVENQEFSDGDWIVTGPLSFANIAFRSGQLLKVGSDTQIQIRGIMQGSSEYSYMVTLSKGAVVAEVTEKQRLKAKKNREDASDMSFGSRLANSYSSAGDSNTSHGMVIRSGNRSFTVDEGKKLGLLKEVGTAEMTKVSDSLLLSNSFMKGRLGKPDNLEADFLPPDARVFSDKKSAIIVTKDAVLSKANLPIEAGRANDRNVSGLVSTESGSPKMAQPQKHLDQLRISRADFTAMSDSSTLSDGDVPSDERSVGFNKKLSSDGSQIASKKAKISDHLPVLKLKEKIDKLDLGIQASKNANVSMVSQSDGNNLPVKNRSFGLRSKDNGSKKVSKQDPDLDKSIINNDVSAIGFEHFLRLENRLLSISVYKSVSALRNGKIRLTLLPPTKKPAVGQLRPVLELVGKQGSKIPIVEGNINSDSEIILPLDLVIKYGREKFVGVFKEYEVSARAGSVLTVNGKKSQAFERVFSVIKVTGLGGGSSQGITVGLDNFDAGRSNNGNSSKKPEISTEIAPIRISLQSENDLPLISPFIEKASRVGFSKGGPRDDLGYFVVRNQAVIAEIAGSGLTRGILQNIVTALRGDFVFRGLKNALHEPGDKSQRDLTTWVDSLLDQGKVLYVMKRSRLYPVSREFVKTNNEVAKFIDSQAKAVFVEKVDVIYFR